MSTVAPRNGRVLMPHQRQALRFLNAHQCRALLAMAPGTGKTLTAIRRALAKRWAVLVICRRDDYLTWRTELLAEGVIPARILTVDKPDDVMALKKKRWTIVTYDLIGRTDFVYHTIRLHQDYFDCVVADESDYLSGWKSKRQRRVIGCTREIPHRIAMTGSAFGNDPPMDIHRQAQFVDDGATFGRSPTEHRARYYGKSGPGWYMRRTAMDEIKQRCKRFMFSVHEDDVLALPPKRYLLKSYPMTAPQRRAYDSLLTKWEVELDDGPLEVDHTVAQLLKLHQIANGFMYDDRMKVHEFAKTKMDALAAMLTNGLLADYEKVVIWCAHIESVVSLHRWLYNFRAPGVTFHGGMRPKDREESRRRFHDDPRIRVFIGQADGGRGMNELRVANAAVYYSNSWRVRSREQSERRIRRRGSEGHDHCLYVDMVTEGTIDVKIHQALKRGKDAVQGILAALKGGRGIRRALG